MPVFRDHDSVLPLRQKRARAVVRLKYYCQTALLIVCAVGTGCESRVTDRPTLLETNSQIPTASIPIPDPQGDHAEDVKHADGNVPPAPADSGTASAVHPAESAPAVASFQRVPEFSQELALLPSVFWEPQDSLSLRTLIAETDIVRGKQVLEVGTGSGLIALCCLKAGAVSVVATDINPQAIRCAMLNAETLGFATGLQCRLVPARDPSAWSVIRPEERFDVIISNPPWENRRPETVAEYALYDPDFALMKSLIHGAKQHLRPQGKLLLAYGCVTAIRRIQEVARDAQTAVRILDDRSLDTLPEVFLPGMLLELTALP